MCVYINTYMADAIRNVIGEGTYGCAIYPSLTCGNKQLNYENKISKIMLDTDAVQELNEYETIGNIDRDHNYYLGKPTRCIVKNTNSNLEAIAKCKNGRNFLDNLRKSALLVMNFGGGNLEDFAKVLKSREKSPVNTKKMHDFWIEAHRLLLGVKVFLDNDILHHDLKPQNIVYNEAENRINFIDFGMMTSISSTIQTCKNSRNHYSIFHWSYPLEHEFINRTTYNAFAAKSKKQREQYLQRFIKHVNGTKVTDKKRIHFLSFLNFVVGKELPNEIYKDTISRYVADYNDTLLGMTLDNYDEFLEKSVRTMDVYGVGISLMYVLVNSRHLIDQKLSLDLSELFHNMVHSNLNRRITVDTAISSYEEILESNGLTAEFGKHFENNVLVEGDALSPIVAQLLDSINPVVIKSFNVSDEVILRTPNPCPEDKELNAVTKRCIKKCKKDHSRNAKTKRCVKNRNPEKNADVLIKASAAASAARAATPPPQPQEEPEPQPQIQRLKDCPEGKIRNPKTNRCIKNPNMLKTQKRCPEGKILNPKTNRCIKIK